jgi:transcription initiation factor TFIIE subunit alpha
MIKARLRMETGPDGKATRQNYHYINYRAFVNVVKYKLDHMRRKIETEERDNTSRASFVCSKCGKTYTDLETGQLVNLSTGELHCLHCGEIVEEDPNVLPKADSRLILAKFNEQIEPLYILLKEVEDIVLPADLLDPEIQDSNGMNGQLNNNKTSDSSSFGANPWSSRGRSQADYDAMMMNTSLTVNIEDDNISASANQENKKDIPEKKEQPSWMTGSTVDFVDDDHSINSSVNSSFLKHPIKQEYPSDIDTVSNGMNSVSSKTTTRASSFDTASVLSETDIALAKEIIENLVRCEGLSGSSGKTGSSLEDALSFLHGDMNHSLHKNSNSHHDNDIEMESYNEEDMEVDHNGDFDHSHRLHTSGSNYISFGPRVRVNGKLILLKEVTESLVEQMSDSEKQEYINLCQEFYSHLYD